MIYGLLCSRAKVILYWRWKVCPCFNKKRDVKCVPKINDKKLYYNRINTLTTKLHATLIHETLKKVHNEFFCIVMKTLRCEMVICYKKNCENVACIVKFKYACNF